MLINCSFILKSSNFLSRVHSLVVKYLIVHDSEIPLPFSSEQSKLFQVIVTIKLVCYYFIFFIVQDGRKVLLVYVKGMY